MSFRTNNAYILKTILGGIPRILASRGCDKPSMPLISLSRMSRPALGRLFTWAISSTEDYFLEAQGTSLCFLQINLLE
jgi:hypothetical protein